MTTLTSHASISRQEETDRICGMLVQMAELTQTGLRGGLEALLTRDKQTAYYVILGDRHLDALDEAIDRLCLEFLVKRQPVEANLRLVYTAIKINAALERVGDYAESIARQVFKLGTARIPVETDTITEMANCSIGMVRDAVQAFVEQDEVLARKTIAVEDVVDLYRSEIDTELLRRSDQLPTDQLISLMTIVRRFERVSDQAKSICQEALYLITGEYAKHQGSEVLRVLVVDREHGYACRMAEAIGTALAPERMVFSSAGIAPRLAKPETIQFLAGKGLDISRQPPRALEQVPNLNYYQVIVALDGDAARAAFPTPPTKTVCLTWDVPPNDANDPKRSHDEAYEFLRTNLQALCQAITGHTTKCAAETASSLGT